jgi:hypothetical protein
MISTEIRPGGPAGTAAGRDDRIRPGTRALLGSFAVLTAVATFSLLVLGHTERFWPWQIKNPASTGFLAAAYGAGFLLSVLSLRQRSWTHVRIAVATVTVFTFLTLIATIVHAHRLHLHDADPVARGAAWFWLAVYVAVPLIGVAVIGRQEEDRRRHRDVVLRPLPGGLRLALAAQGIVLFAAGAVLFLGAMTWHHGMSAIGIWPWQLTPLSAEVLGSWLAAFGVGAALVLAERDLARLRVPAIAYTAFGAFQLVALLANASRMDDTTWGYGLVLVLVTVTGTYGWWMTRPVARWSGRDR